MIDKINCIVCDKEMEQIYKALDKDIKEGRPYHGCWSDGAVQVIETGYGSSLDGECYLIGVCDDCLNAKFNEGKIRFIRDYMFPYNPKEPYYKSTNK